MEPKLSTFIECYRNIELFANRLAFSDNGRFINRSTNGVVTHFVWLYNSMFHRIDGPAAIWYDGDLMWFFMGNRVHVENQEEFDEYVIEKIGGI